MVFRSISIPTLALAFAATLLPISAEPVSVTTDPVGVISFELTPGADNFVTFPLKSAPLYVGLSESADFDSENDELVLVLDADIEGGDDSLADFYYVRFLDGDAEGKFFTIIANSIDSITLDTIGDDLSGVSAEDRFEVLEYWTLGTLFPPGEQDAIVESPNSFQRESRILLPDLAGSGVNRAAASTFYLLEGEGWRRVGSGQTSFNDQVLLPETFIIVRQPSGAGDRTFALSGHVPMGAHTLALFSESTGSQDNLLSHGRPIGLRLDELGLGEEFRDSPNAFQRVDRLLVWKNPSGVNPAPDNTFFRVEGEWRRVGGGSTSYDGFVISHNMAFIIRKEFESEPSTNFWTNLPTY